MKGVCRDGLEGELWEVGKGQGEIESEERCQVGVKGDAHHKGKPTL